MGMDMELESEQSEEVEPEVEETPKKLGKFNPDLVYTLTDKKTGEVMEVIGGVGYVVDKLTTMGCKASKSGLNNAVNGVTKSHCGYVITSNQPQKKVKKASKKSKTG